MRLIAILLLIFLCGCTVSHKSKSAKKATYRVSNKTSAYVSDSGTDDTTAFITAQYMERDSSALFKGNDKSNDKGPQGEQHYTGAKTGGGSGAKPCGYDKNGNWGIIGADGYVVGSAKLGKATKSAHLTKSQLRKATAPVAMDTIVVSNPDAPNLGVITYYVPDTMKVGTEYHINLRIARYLSASISEGMPSASVTQPIRVGGTMKAVIKETDPAQNAFKIDTLSTGTQTIEKDSSFTTWEWTVMPLKSGKQGLKLTVVIKDNGLTKDIPVYERDIIVQASPGYSVKTFFSNNWELFVSGLAFPIILLWFKRRKNKKEDNDEDA